MFHQGAATSPSQSSSDESFHPSDDTSVGTSLTASQRHLLITSLPYILIAQRHPLQ